MDNLVTLDGNSPSIQYLVKKDKRLARVIDTVGPISYTPHYGNEYNFLVHEIIEQMLSVKAGRKIYDRLALRCENSITPENISKLTDEEIRSTGTSSAKVSYIRNITNAVLDGSLSFNALENAPDDEVIIKLISFRGIGTWTAKMYLIFVLNRPDVLPYEDGAFLQSYRWLYKTTDCKPASIIKRCKKWKPYSSIAARYLYRVLDLGMTKAEFHLFKED